jgi:hypothetical protein
LLREVARGLHQRLEQRCATVLQRLESDGRIVRGALLPAPRAAPAPGARQGPYGGLLGLPLGAWRLVVPLGPEGLPARLRRPVDACLPEARGTWAAPVPPRVLAAPVSGALPA